MSFSPVLGNPKPQFEEAATGIPSVNSTLTFYEAGTSTLLDTYTDSSGSTANDNPLTLNSRGEPENAIGGATMIYGDTLTPYKVVLKDSAGATVWTIDDVYPGSKVDEWVSATAATRASATTFTVTGVDVTSTFTVGRRVKCTGGADRYGTITDSVFGADTTVTVADITDSSGTVATLHVSMDTAYVGLNSVDFTSSAVNYYPVQPWETEANILNLDYEPSNVLRYIPRTLIRDIKKGTGSTDLTTYFTNLGTDVMSSGASRYFFIPAGKYKIDTAIFSDGATLNRVHMKGEVGVHTGGGNGATEIDLSGNTTYFCALGYGFTVENIQTNFGVNVFRHTSEGTDFNTTRMINVRAFTFSGTFFEMFGAGNGSHHSWVRPVIVSNNSFTSSLIWDNEGLPTDNLTIDDGWFEIQSDIAFKIQVGRLSIRATRFIPYTNVGSLWIDSYGDNSKILVYDSDFGGESGRQLVKIRGTGSTLHFMDVDMSSLAGITGITLLGAPDILRFDLPHGTIAPGKLITIDPAMDAANLRYLSKTKLVVDGDDQKFKPTMIDTASTNNLFAMAAKTPDPHIEGFIQVADVVATSGSSWQTGGSDVNSTVVVGASAPDPLGAADWGYKITATGDSSGSRLYNNGPNVAAIPDGEHTYEAIATIENGSVVFGMLFADDGTNTQRKTYNLGPGVHHICVPFDIATSATRNLGFEWSMKSGTILTVTRIRVMRGFYHKRRWDVADTAAPVASNWHKGDRVINSNPTVGQPKAWTCTVSGAPGTWVSEGNL